MTYNLFPPVKHQEYCPGVCNLSLLTTAMTSSNKNLFYALPDSLHPQYVPSESWVFRAGNTSVPLPPDHVEGYTLVIAEDGIAVSASDENGLRYGIDTLAQILSQCNSEAACITIHDYPIVPKRGLMLDVSRGKVYTLDYLLDLAQMLSDMRCNVLQLYIEHTFDFKKHPEICEGADPISSSDILALQDRCEALGIELQANLQCLGHCRRILTREQHMELAESDMFWSLCTTSDRSVELIDDMFSEYLPLFHSKWVNICFDEPYDIGKGKSAALNPNHTQLYVGFLNKVHSLAAKYGKQIMMFGDVFMRHPECLSMVPKDICYLDWCYDPKPFYGSPAKFREYGLDFWICPGTGNWNTLFPRLDGSILNVDQFVSEGIASGAGGMLFTDWNDHGGYTQPGAGYYAYGYAFSVAWAGQHQEASDFGPYIDRILNLPGYSAIIRTLAEIYQMPPIWSKNRSECVMALFDEPIFGNAIRGPVPPTSLKAYDLNLPDGIVPVYERHSQHPLRPYFCIPEITSRRIHELAESAKARAQQLQSGNIRSQLIYIADAFLLMTDKLALSRKIVSRFNKGGISIKEYVLFEDEVRLMIARYVRLQLSFIRNWERIANESEIEITMTYFAHIIERLDYLRDWLSIQRDSLSKGETPDEDFTTYETAGYETLPTY